MSDRIYYGNASDAQRECIQERIQYVLGFNQSSLVGDILLGEHGHEYGISYDDIVNFWPGEDDIELSYEDDKDEDELYKVVVDLDGDTERVYVRHDEWSPDEGLEELKYLYDVEVAINELVGNAHPREVFEWWSLHPGEVRYFKKAGQVVLDTDYGAWWGRQCTGQSLKLDAFFWDFFQSRVQDVESNE